MKYQIYCDRNDGNGECLDGCWGSEDAAFDSLNEAGAAAKSLGENYPDCDWVVKNNETGDVELTVSATAESDED